MSAELIDLNPIFDRLPALLVEARRLRESAEASARASIGDRAGNETASKVVQVGEWVRSLDAATDPLIADIDGGEIIGKGQLGVLYGGQGSGKTAVNIAFGFAIAGGGLGRAHLSDAPIYRAETGRAIFAIYEDPQDFRRRLLAEVQTRGLDIDALNIAIISDTLNVAKEKDRAELLKRIEADAKVNGPPAFLSIDTVAAALGTESYSGDDVVGALFDFGRALRKAHGTTMMLVHHPGKDATKGMAGSYRFESDPDFILQAVPLRNGYRLRKLKDRNGAKRHLFEYTLNFVEVERSSSDDPRTGAILGDINPCQQEPPQSAAHDASAGVEGGPRRKLPDRYKLALEALTEALIDAGRPAPTAMKLPKDVRVVALDAWRGELFTRGILDQDAKNPRQDFKRMREGLAARKLIAERDGLAWLAKLPEA